MTDKVQDSGTDTGENIQQTEKSSLEQDARAQGWVPKEDFQGDKNVWIDADEFVRRRPLFEKIDKQNRELKDVKKALAELASHHSQVRETEYKRALETLKQEKAAAFEEGDAKKLVDIDDRIADVKEQQKALRFEQESQARQVTQQVHPEFQEWNSRNPWYNSDRTMTAYANAIGADIAASGTRTPAEVLKEVEKSVKRAFADKFQNPNRDKPGSVEGTSSKGTNPKTDYSPTELERQVAKRFVRQGVFKSEDEYYKQLKQINGKS